MGEITHTILRRVLLPTILALGALYLGDYVALHYRIARSGPAAALETVTVLYGTQLKNGQVKIFWDQPQTETCTRSIFPHLGNPPCWYAKRHATKLITEQPPSFSIPKLGRSDLSHAGA
jgi:hypothetical protein